ncbi:hypothetical protein GGD81_004610 [Rhodobium orientis]|nr:antirestriction protein ArdA [Rhodobium orientis]MBB4305530.1 hypothetical protein [Rhodobium orientis]
MSTLPLTCPPATVYYARPYNIQADGFYFATLAEYAATTANHLDRLGRPVVEYDIQFIDGDNWQLFDALAIDQTTLTTWFQTFAALDPEADDYLKALYLAQNGYAMADIPERLDDLAIWHGSAEEYARELIAECYAVPEPLRFYIDYAAFARDMRLNGELNELDTERGTVVVIGY